MISHTLLTERVKARVRVRTHARLLLVPRCKNLNLVLLERHATTIMLCRPSKSQAKRKRSPRRSRERGPRTPLPPPVRSELGMAPVGLRVPRKATMLNPLCPRSLLLGLFPGLLLSAAAGRVVDKCRRPTNVLEIMRGNIFKPSGNLAYAAKQNEVDECHLSELGFHTRLTL
jgi:hypothetical protein